MPLGTGDRPAELDVARFDPCLERARVSGALDAKSLSAWLARVLGV